MFPEDYLRSVVPRLLATAAKGRGSERLMCQHCQMIDMLYNLFPDFFKDERQPPHNYFFFSLLQHAKFMGHFSSFYFSKIHIFLYFSSI
jgi:hypothetical protein